MSVAQPRPSPTPGTVPAVMPRARGGLARSFLLFLLPLVLGPLVTVAVILYQQIQADITRQVTAQLMALSSLKESQIEQWAEAHINGLDNLARSPDLLEIAWQLRRAPAEGRARATERLTQFASANPEFKSLLIADAATGRAVAASRSGEAMVGESFAAAPFFEAARFSALLDPPHYDPMMDPDAISIIVAAPVTDPRQGTLYVLIGVLRDTPLLRIVSPAPGLGRTGSAYLVTADGDLLGRPLGEGRAPVTSLAISEAVARRTDGSATYLNHADRDVVGVYNWLPGYQLALLVEQDVDEAFAAIARTTAIFAVVIAAAIVVSVVAILLLTRRLTRPIEQLTDRAQQLAAGDLTARVAIRQQDEIGQLAQAFNQMAGQLRELYETQETVVQARTQQIAAAAEVGRAAASILDTDRLLQRVVELIRERFGYDYVSVYLLDETREFAVLREVSGEASAQIKAAGLRLAVGSQSMVGWVTTHRQARVAQNVASDAVFQADERLPDVRSEAALPLRLGEAVIGVLDVQSRQPDAFGDLDVEALQLLADQLAVAVENGRLFARQQRVVQLEKTIINITGKIHQTFQLDAILENAATELGRVLGARRAVVRLHPSPIEPTDDNGRAGNGAEQHDRSS